ncbi:tyrosine-type recombinase/integrase [Parvularcula marina]|uniref:tyrosine-type recombinase/integrase n=1 Tax=Parvularcula marina TaxID=2292771 RepID=UPI003512EFBF
MAGNHTPSEHSPAKHTMMGGSLHLYKRSPTAKFWQCATFMNGKNWRTSTKERDLSKAKDFAEGWYLTLRDKSRHGELRAEKSFAYAAKSFITYFEAETRGRRNPKYVERLTRTIENYLIPYFGKQGLSEITAGEVQNYRIHRQTHSVRRYNQVSPPTHKPPSISTLDKEIIAIRQVLKHAVYNGWLAFVPDLSNRYTRKTKIVRRAWFSPEEYKQLYTATRNRARESVGKRWEWETAQLHDLVLFMANTGLRPDEILNLEYRDITIAEDLNSGETILEIEVRGKRGVGYCKSTANAVHPLERLIERNKPQLTDRVFSSLHRELFNRILNEEGLKTDREGQSRTAYSLRHTYICLRLMEGADIYQIAKNCRTSVEMIEKYYADHIKNRIDASAVNVRRIKPLTRTRPLKLGGDDDSNSLA